MMPIKKLISCLSIKELYGLVSVLISLVIGCGILGYNIRGWINRDKIEISAELARADGELQAGIRNRPSVVTFEQFLGLAASEKWPDAYALLSSTWKETYHTADSLAWDYRMTDRYVFHYYIPTVLNDVREEFDVDFSYWDFFPDLPVTKSLRSTPLGNILTDSTLNAITSDFQWALRGAYVVPATAMPELRGRIKSYVAEQMTLRDLVVRDEIIEIIGKQLGFVPIAACETGQGYRPSTEKRRFFHVVLLKEPIGWKVDSYKSFMIERI